ncbi:unnamed protein product [Chrysoparadoxa australica]
MAHLLWIWSDTYLRPLQLPMRKRHVVAQRRAHALVIAM